MTHTLPLSEEDRQLVLMALAHLAVERPGLGRALELIALRVDNAEFTGDEASPVIFSEFKKVHKGEAIERTLAFDADRQAFAYRSPDSGDLLITVEALDFLANPAYPSRWFRIAKREGTAVTIEMGGFRVLPFDPQRDAFLYDSADYGTLAIARDFLEAVAGVREFPGPFFRLNKYPNGGAVTIDIWSMPGIAPQTQVLEVGRSYDQARKTLAEAQLNYKLAEAAVEEAKATSKLAWKALNEAIENHERAVNSSERDAQLYLATDTHLVYELAESVESGACSADAAAASDAAGHLEVSKTITKEEITEMFDQAEAGTQLGGGKLLAALVLASRFMRDQSGRRARLEEPMPDECFALMGVGGEIAIKEIGPPYAEIDVSWDGLTNASGKPSSKLLEIRELRELGILQETNRCWFHPLGLALAILSPTEDAEDGRLVIMDARDDPQGIVFSDGVMDPDKFKAFSAFQSKRYIDRARELGFIFQPASGSEIGIGDGHVVFAATITRYPGDRYAKKWKASTQILKGIGSESDVRTASYTSWIAAVDDVKMRIEDASGVLRTVDKHWIYE